MRFSVHIGNQIRRRREALGISQQKLADAMQPQFKQQVISKMERGTMDPSSSVLFELANLLDVEVSYFFEGLVLPSPMPAFKPHPEDLDDAKPAVKTSAGKRRSAENVRP